MNHSFELYFCLISPVYQSFFTHPDNQQVFLFVFMFQIIIVLMPPFDIIVENWNLKP